MPAQRVFYYVRADYGDTISLVPTTMTLTLENRSTEDSVSFTFSNVDLGGASGTEQRIDAVAFLDEQGCKLAFFPTASSHGMKPR